MLPALLAVVAAAAPLVTVEAEPVPTLITNVWVLSPDGTVGEPRDVLLEEGRIALVRPLGEGWGEAPERVIDGRGHTLLPGLVDTHVHLGSTTAVPGRIRLPNVKHNLAGFLYAGVTTVVDLSMSRDDLERWQRRVDKGRVDGPAVYGSGKPFDPPGGHVTATVRTLFPGPLVKAATKGLAWEVETAEDVDRALSKQGATDFVKVMLDAIPAGEPNLSDEALERLRQGATAFGSRMVVHVGRPEDLERALAVGADALVHAPYVGAITEDQAQVLAERGTPVAPTLAVWDAFRALADRAPLQGPLDEALRTKAHRRDVEAARLGKASVPASLAPWVAELAQGHDDRRGNVAVLHEAGVPLILGSDSPGIGLLAGGTTHLEVDLLAEAGLSAPSVLTAATWNAARFADPEGDFGAVREEWQADLLLVRGDPSADLSALHDIAAIWVDGRRVTRRGQ